MTRTIPGVNDLKTKFPELLKDWDYEKNSAIGLYPDEIPYNLMKKVYWICHECGHRWSVNVNSRTTNGRGCIKCGHKVGKALKYQNMLAERGGITDELLLKEWDYEKNDGLKPEDVSYSAGNKVWWICREGHDSYFATPSHRVNGTGCPLCGNRKITEKFSKAGDQFSKEETFIKTYESAKVAATEIGVSPSAICNSISGKAKSSGGFIWKMHED